jgi:hypothetical protein
MPARIDMRNRLRADPIIGGATRREPRSFRQRRRNSKLPPNEIISSNRASLLLTAAVFLIAIATQSLRAADDSQAPSGTIPRQLPSTGLPTQVSSASKTSSDDRSLLEFLVDFEVSQVTHGLFDTAPLFIPSRSWLQSGYSSLHESRIWRELAIQDQNRNGVESASPLAGIRAIVAPVAAAAQMVSSQEVKVPNNFMYVRFSKAVLESYVCKRFDQTAPVSDTILGACVSGTSRTIGHSELELVDNPAQAQAKLILTGAMRFNTVGRSGPIQVYSRGTTSFTSAKGMWFDGLSEQESAAQSSVSTDTTTTGISTCLPRLLGRISLRIASRREAESHGLAERIASQRASQKIERAFDSVVRNRIAEFTLLLSEQYAKLPLEGKYALTDIRCNTTRESLELVLLGRNDTAPIFVAAPARLPEHPDIEIHIHTALIRKAILDTEFRNTLQATLASIIDQPLSQIGPSVPSDSPALKERGPKFRWAEGSNTDWLTISWNAHPQDLSPENKQADNLTAQ